MTSFKSIFPFNQTEIAEYKIMDKAAIDNALALSEKIFPHWSGKPFEYHAEILKNVAGLLLERKEKLATLMTNEMGKVVKEAVAEVEKCALGCNYYAENAQQFLQDEIVKTGYKKSFVTYQPLGAIFAIMPWNFPLWQVFRFAAPTLMAGNVALLKHSPNVCGCSLAIQQLFEEAGAEPGVFQSLIADTDVTEKILSSNIVQAVSLTGSEKAGSSVASIASAHIKKSVLELGGSDAFIVLTDADVQKAASVAVTSRMQNAGQSCIAAKRFLVVNEVADDFTEAVKQEINKLKQGDPFDTSTTTGPMARLDLAEKLQAQLQASVAKGAEVILGGTRSGCNYQPTLLLNVQAGMPAFDEETFGPLFSIISVRDEEEAIALANSSRYGLGGNIWTQDLERGVMLSKKLNSGSVFINSMVKSEPALPFGGVKKSGYGRELSKHGMIEFVNVKTITVSD
ncbi:NAD-dependent succinate-semialdehyde dehydrogenase [Parafilimonas sp.]|uniref:NAD-dependent succinate-semialdehyde dehydrogenase n=1 Tax=Parafilimonas sp. TaxID=1969739 RepID=UPI003F7FD200